MQATDISGEESIVIEAPPSAVYAAVSDVTVLGKMSTECQSCEWTEPGERFVGHNQMGDIEWSTVCHVVRSEPGEEFAYQSGSDEERFTEWRYIMEPLSDGGTRLTESFRVLQTPPPLIGANEERMLGRQQMLLDGARHTLESLKAHIEGSR